MGDVKEEEISSSGSGSERGGRGEEDKLPARSARGPNTVTGPQPAAIETAMEAMDVEPVAVETMLSGVGLIMTSNETLSIPSTSGTKMGLVYCQQFIMRLFVQSIDVCV